MERELRCIRCGKTYDVFSSKTRCECGGLLEVSLKEPLHPSFKETFLKRRMSLKPYDQSGVWRYREFVLDIEEDSIVTLPEGRTNLYKKIIDGMEVYFKHEGENPTGSFKDRGMTVGVSVAKKLGFKITACASTGNTSASLASYSSHAGLKSVVFIPKGKVAIGKLSQALSYGANVLEIEGDFDYAMKLVEDASYEYKLYLLNSLNPLRLEGQKTIIINALEELDFEVPDWIIVPGGNLGNTSAFGKALKELYEFHFIDKIPRLAVIQAEAASPFYKAFKNDFKKFEPMKAETIATAIRIGNPVNYEKAVQSIKFTNGIVESVSDAEILEAKRDIDNIGIGCEPSSASTLAGLRKLRRSGVIRSSDKVLLILTGNLLKDPDTSINLHTGMIQGVSVTNRFFAISNLKDLEIILKKITSEVS
ncbi:MULTISPECIES: threonine synthase [Caldisericum]|jgi:threonine synthase|uniref:Threonine synthase n=1 Tax=Caldisericum exile TaxID=693075 RepID=A0A2J6WE96_9BACT|nr:MAG: threonine synthase [Caldisericum exile]